MSGTRNVGLGGVVVLNDSMIAGIRVSASVAPQRSLEPLLPVGGLQ